MNRWQNFPVMFCIFFSLLEILHHTAVKQDFLASLPNLPFLLAQHLTLKLCIFPSNVPVSFLSHPVFNHGHSLPPLALSNYRISHGFFICLFLTGLFFSSYFSQITPELDFLLFLKPIFCSYYKEILASMKDVSRHFIHDICHDFFYSQKNFHFPLFIPKKVFILNAYVTS